MSNPANSIPLQISHIRKDFDSTETGRLPLVSNGHPTSVRSHLAINTSEGMYILDQQEIIRCTAESNYCSIHYGNNHQLLASKTLKSIQGLLDEMFFVRIHQSHLVRTSAIRVIRKDKVVLRNGESLPLSRAQRPELIKHINSIANTI